MFRRPNPLTLVERTLKGRHPKLRLLRAHMRSPWLTEQHKHADEKGAVRAKELIDDGEPRSCSRVW